MKFNPLNLFFKAEKRSYPNFVSDKDVQKVVSMENHILQQLAQAYNISFESIDSKQTLEQISVIHQIVDTLSNTLARVPFSIVTDVDSNGDFEDFKTNFWYVPVKLKPNSTYSDYEFRRLIATSVLIDGNAYVYKNIAKRELEFVHPDLIDQIILVNGEKCYHSKQLNHIFLSDEILHFKTFSNNGLKGLSKLKVAQVNAGLLHLATRTSEEYYRHGARSPIMIERDFDKALNQASLDEAILEMEAKYLSGAASIRKMFVLPASLKAKELKLKSEDIMFTQVAQFTSESLMNLWGLPSYLGYSSKGSAGKYEQESLSFKNTTLANYLESFKSVYVDGLLSIEDRINLNATVIYDLSKVQDLDFSTLSTQAVQLSNNGLITKNEGRRMIGYRRFDSENADKLLTQSQWVDLDSRDISNTSTSTEPVTSTGSTQQ